MSAMLLVLPRVWACATGEGSVAMAAGAVYEHRAGVMQSDGRKGPQTLRLVKAQGEVEPAAAVEKAKAPRRQAVSVGGVGYEFYRKYTEAMLGRYMKLSMESGRVPSMLGQEMFRGRVTSYRVHSFEDVVIFVHDVGKCLGELDRAQQHLVRRIALEEYTQGETAAMLGMSLRTVVRRYAEAIDKLTRMFLERKMLEPLTECEG